MAHSCLNIAYSFIISLLSVYLYLSVHASLSPLSGQFLFAKLVWGLFFFAPGASSIPFPTRPQCPPRPQATAMEICFSHIANYLRVVTSLTVLGDNEWLIGHSSHRQSALVFSNNLPFSPSLAATCLTGCTGFCCPVWVSSSVLHSMHMFQEVTGNVINGCEAGSAVKGTWLVFVSTMIPQASKCWGTVLLESVGSGHGVQTANDWYCLLGLDV